MEVGREIARGGEGTIFEVTGSKEVAAKIYHIAPTPARAAKLSALVELSNPTLLRTAAWPTATLHDSKQAIVGFLMPRISGYHDLHILYGPRSRLHAFPNVGYTFLVRTAANLSRAFDKIHAHGQIIGDVNDRVALVSPESATVHLVDCDSFQVHHWGQVFTCDVGTPIFQPPELQRLVSFREQRRALEHDRFGLAVLVFQLLFFARHPFAGTFLGPGDMSIERAIEEGRFVYGARSAQLQMRAPPNSLRLEDLDPGISQLFERAFSLEPPAGRPSAREWSADLALFEESLKPCSRNPNHTFFKGLSGCPICRIEVGAAVVLFGFPIYSSTPGPDLDKLWRSIEEVPKLQPAELPQPLIRFEELSLSETGRRVQSAQSTRFLLGIMSLLCAVGALAVCIEWQDIIATSCLASAAVLLIWRISREATVVHEARQILEQADSRVKALERRWQSETSHTGFEEMYRALQQAATELGQLSSERARRLHSLEANRPKAQLESFLDAHRIARATIPGIGPARKATLESFGIETARDVSSAAVEAIKGFGPELTTRLTDWRLEVERRFVFDPQRPVEPRLLAEVDRELGLRRSELAKKLAEGPTRLLQLRATVEHARYVVGEALRTQQRELLQAQRDLVP